MMAEAASRERRKAKSLIERLKNHEAKEFTAVKHSLGSAGGGEVRLRPSGRDLAGLRLASVGNSG
jgi:hypothetical protein